MRKRLRVLIACEESQAECIAWRELGHLAFSCDIQPCKRNGKPGWHIWDDVTELYAGRNARERPTGQKTDRPLG